MNYTLPTQIALCPECDGQLIIEIDEWESDSRKPTDCGITVSCKKEWLAQFDLIAGDISIAQFDEISHAHYFNIWIKAQVEVAEWAIAHIRVSRAENKHGSHNLKVVNWGKKNKKNNPNHKRNIRRFTQ